MTRRMDRRQFLRQSAAGAGLVALGGCNIPFTDPAAPLESFLGDTDQADVIETTEAVVIGSGFGGAVAALRLGQAGVPTVVLERGRRWPIVPTSDTFATPDALDGRAEWFRTQSFDWAGFAPSVPIDAQAGVLDVREDGGVVVLRGAGVGGGSLVYYATTIQPAREDFRRIFPSGLDYDEFDQVWFPRVRAMLNPSPIPDDVLESKYFTHLRAFAAQAHAAGLDPQRLDMNIRWDVVREELAGLRPAAAIVGELQYGCNSGAKNSLDQNYLPQAEATGFVEIRPLHVVQSIAERDDGTYAVRYVRIDVTGNILTRGELRATHVFLAAGSWGTTELLVRARAAGTLMRLSDSIGAGWGNNGQTAAGLLTPGTAQPRWGQMGIAALARHPTLGPTWYESFPLADLREDIPLTDRALTLILINLPEARGQIEYDAQAQAARLHWSGGREAELRTRDAVLRFLRGAALPISIVPSVTAHPLGGAVMGAACDLAGRVQGHPRLYVVDGALLPGSAAGVNPSLTIAAMAERCLTQILAEDFYSVRQLRR